LDDLQVLFQFEDPAEAMYVVLEGELHIFRNERIFSRLGRSQMVGEMALIESTRRTASGRAHGSTRLLEISRESFSQHVLNSRESMIGVARTMTRRLKALTESS